MLMIIAPMLMLILGIGVSSEMDRTKDKNHACITLKNTAENPKGESDEQKCNGSK